MEDPARTAVRLAVWLPISFVLAVVFFLGVAFWAVSPHSPDLMPNTAAALISGAPEFNRYAMLVKVDTLSRAADSLADCCYYGSFTFHYLGSPIDAPLIKANADFGYWDGVWHLNGFDYCDGLSKGQRDKITLDFTKGIRPYCTVDVYKPTPK